MRDDMLKYIRGTNSVSKYNVFRHLNGNAHTIALNAESSKKSEERLNFPRLV